MALTIKKTKSGLLIPKTSSSIHTAGSLKSLSNKYFSASEESIVVDQIKLILKEELSIKGKMDVRRINYFVVYQADEETREKQISSIYVQHKITKQTSVLNAVTIEMSGVMLIEFFDYINTYGATEIQDNAKILELA